MELVPVYRFEYFDRPTRTVKLSDDYATAKAINSIGGVIAVDTVKEVPESEVTFSGIWRPAG